VKLPLLTSAAGVRWSMIKGDNGGWRFHAEQDCTPILDRNKAMATHNDGYSPTRDMRRVATIPAVVRLKWINEEGWDYFDATHDPDVARKFAAKLNSSEWAHLRTAPGRVAALQDGGIR
jgi:hypothetical protein